MPSATALRSLEAAEARKQKSELAAREKTKVTSKKKQQQQQKDQRWNKDTNQTSNLRCSTRLNTNDSNDNDVDMNDDLTREKKPSSPSNFIPKWELALLKFYNKHCATGSRQCNRV